MSRNGSGTYSAPASSWNPAVSGALASYTDWNALLTDIANALTQSLSADGQTPISGNLNMNNNKLTGLAAGSGTGQSLRWEQLFSQGTELAIASAATVDIGAQNTNFLNVTGTTTITSFGTNYNGPRFLRFSGAVTLTNSATLIVPGNSNITTAAGDCLIVIPKATAGTSDGWQIVAYQSAAGGPVSGSVTNSSLADGAVYGTKMTDKIQPVTASVASNALTTTLNPTTLDFRSSTVGSGTVNTRTVAAAISCIVPSGATLGFANATLSKVMLLAIDNAGTVELAVCNSSIQLDESTLISTTAIGGASTSATTIYSTTARTSVPFRIVGYVESTQATAGTWATAPSKIQGTGGQIRAATASGVNQLTTAKAWVNFNGTGTIAIRSSYNVSSITDNGVGDYTINFTTALNNANYAYSAGFKQNSTGSLVNCIAESSTVSRTTSAIRLAAICVYATTAAQIFDVADCDVVIFGE